MERNVGDEQRASRCSSSPPLLSLTLTPFALGAPTVPAPAAAATATCDHDFLKAQAALYVAAQKAGTPSLLLANSSAASITYTQNFKTATITTGILSTPLRIDHNRSCSTYDTTQCNAPPTPSSSPRRLGLFDPASTLKYSSQGLWDEIPSSKRDTRAVIQAAGDAYLDLFNDKTVKVPWGNPCARLEGGESCAAYVVANVGVPSGIKNVNRRYLCG
ncbi:hypothetical protein QBC32DRAFT_374517 [Pseudoneurospora amorphoporcata]|uniref:DUF8021 domain-containing protein n=1 Tax=Pseudoneurospora amorphoporcata TaxID=241081 RepID=A0AAN6NJS8_9PEZI|nr:hypothetical protein QBC32DRAFT_374517 [Pseudoneurospora amorphoporcata]